MRMQWGNLLFMHWPVPASELRPLIPNSLEIDEFDGTAWIGLIPFTMRDVLPAAVPHSLKLGDIPGFSAFHECNVRTYVHPRGRPDLPGVWFFSLDAASRCGVWAAKRFFRLRYFHSRITLRREGDVVRYAVDRVHSPQASMTCEWRIGEPLPRSAPGELAHFLTERYMLFTTNGECELRCCHVAHEPWPLRRAELISLNDSLIRAAGIEIDQSQPPVLHYADVIDTRAWRLERLDQ